MTVMVARLGTTQASSGLRPTHSAVQVYWVGCAAVVHVRYLAFCHAEGLCVGVRERNRCACSLSWTDRCMSVTCPPSWTQAKEWYAAMLKTPRPPSTPPRKPLHPSKTAHGKAAHRCCPAENPSNRVDSMTTQPNKITQQFSRQRSVHCHIAAAAASPSVSRQLLHLPVEAGSEARPRKLVHHMLPRCGPHGVRPPAVQQLLVCVSKGCGFGFTQVARAARHHTLSGSAAVDCNDRPTAGHGLKWHDAKVLVLRGVDHRSTGR